MNETKRVYADNAATTKLCIEAFDKMVPLLRDHFGNPSGIYEEGVYAKRMVGEARREIAKTLGCFEKEIIFTGGGSEADNLALIGVMEANRERGRHLITSNIEHHAVLSACKWLEKNGYRVTYIKAKENGCIDADDVRKEICEDTVMVSVMYANNELGTLQPIEEIAKICKEKSVLLHTDAVQAYGKIDIKPEKLGVDLLSASAHKFNGPKGSGFLYVKSGTPINSFVHGGSQERGLRAGTENVAGIVGMGEAARVAALNLDERFSFDKELTLRLKDRIEKEISGVSFNGNTDLAIPGILNISIDGIEGSSLLIMLDMKGVAASAGSACAQSLEEPSHVLLAIGLSEEKVRSSIRLSINHENTQEDIDLIVERLKESVEYLRIIRN